MALMRKQKKKYYGYDYRMDIIVYFWNINSY